MEDKINKLKTLIGFAIKSGSIIWGYDNIFSYKKHINLIIFNSNNTDKIKLKVFNFAETNNISLIELNEHDLTFFTHKPNVKAVAILNNSLAAEILNNKYNEFYKIIKRGNF